MDVVDRLHHSMSLGLNHLFLMTIILLVVVLILLYNIFSQKKETTFHIILKVITHSQLSFQVKLRPVKDFSIVKVFT